MPHNLLRAFFILAIACLGVAASPSLVSAREAAMLRADAVYPGARRFEFSQWPGPSIDVWLYRPAEAGADAPVLFVMHGVQRDADRYLREWAPVARAYGAVLVVPEFSRANFPGSQSYNLGATFDSNGAPVDRAHWSYSALEPIFDAVVARESLSATRYLLFGHSAGAQFVHRFVMLGAGARLQRAVAANAGWYTLPDTSPLWPYGLGGGPPALTPSAMFEAPLFLVLGDRDIDPEHGSLSREPGAMAQGAARFERGQNFYAVARAAAAAGAAPLGWGCYIAPGLAHDNALAARYGAQILFGGALPVGGECIVMPSLMER